MSHHKDQNFFNSSGAARDGKQFSGRLDLRGFRTTQVGEQNRFLSLHEASEQTGYHQDYLGSLCRSGRLKGFKKGRKWVTTQAYLDEFVQSVKDEMEKAATTGAFENFSFGSLPDSRLTEDSVPRRESGARMVAAKRNIAVRFSNVLLLGVSVVLAAMLYGSAAKQVLQDFLSGSANGYSMKLYDQKLGVQNGSLQGGVLSANTAVLPGASSAGTGTNVDAATGTTQVLGLSQSEVLDLISQRFSQYLAEGKLASVRGTDLFPNAIPAFQNTNGVQTTVGVGSYPVVSYVQPNPNNNFSGGALFGATELSANNFNSTNGTFTGTLTSSGRANVSGDLNVSGAAVFTATTTITNLNSTSFTAASFNTTGSVGIGTSSPVAALAVVGDGYFTGTVTVGNNLQVGGGSVVIGNSTTTSLTINAQINSNIIPSQNKVYDLGSASYFWNRAYVSQLTVENLSAASTTIGGTTSDNFIINSDNVSTDTESSMIIFDRGTGGSPNALIAWDATNKYFDFSQAVHVQNQDSALPGVITLNAQARSNQTANILQATDSSGNSLFNVGVNGRVTIGAVNTSVATTSPGISGLVAYYGFNNNTGGYVIDNSGNGNNGIVYGSPWSAAGYLGGGMNFNGETSQYVVTNNIQNFATSTITVAFWTKFTSVGSQGFLIYASAVNRDDMEVYMYNDGFDFHMVGNIASIPVVLSDGAWHHVAVTWQSSTGEINVYKDAVLSYTQAGLSTGSTITPGGCLAIATSPASQCRQAQNSSVNRGSMDELRIYDRVLSLSEIQTLYNDTTINSSVSVPPAVLGVTTVQPATTTTAVGTSADNVLAVIGSSGGNTSATTTGVGGAGGGLYLQGGAGGQAYLAADVSIGGAGGAIGIAGGAGADNLASSSSVYGGLGGDVRVAAGGGGYGTTYGGLGGNLVLQGGTAGAASSTNAASSGGNVLIQGGAAAVSAGSSGGAVAIVAAAGSMAGTGGNGGGLTLTGGAAGGDNTVNRSGGAISLTAGVSKGASIGAAVTVTAGAAGMNLSSSASATGPAGGLITFAAGAGGTAPSSTNTSIGGAGGAITLQGSVGGVANQVVTTSNTGGAGSAIVLALGAGGAASNAATTNTGGAAGTFTINGGAGGAGTSVFGNNVGGAGSAVTINGGAGGPASGVTDGDNRAGAGGTITLTAGAGGAATNATGVLQGGNGGALTLSAGAAGAGATAGGNGGAVTISAGSAVASPGSAGGAVTIQARDGSNTGTGGNGGSASLTAGNGRGDGTVARVGGSLTLLAGSSVGAVTGGTVSITTGAGGINASTSTSVTASNSGSMTLTVGSGGTAPNATATSTGGTGGTFTIQGGNGGAASSPMPGGNIGGTGSAIALNLGGGGAVSNASTTNTGGIGSTFTWTAGSGGSATGVTAGVNTGGNGGAVTLRAGTGGSASNASGGIQERRR